MSSLFETYCLFYIFILFELLSSVYISSLKYAKSAHQMVLLNGNFKKTKGQFL